jgi:hypothetical protein
LIVAVKIIKNEDFEIRLTAPLIQPFLTKNEETEFYSLLSDFTKPNGVGETLQSKLALLAEKHPNWYFVIEVEVEW